MFWIMKSLKHIMIGHRDYYYIEKDSSLCY